MSQREGGCAVRHHRLLWDMGGALTLAFPLRKLESLEASRKGGIGVMFVLTGPSPVGCKEDHR